MSATVTIMVRVDIRRRVLGSFTLARLSELTGVPVETLLTPFDTWDDDAAEGFLEALCDDDESWGMTVRDDSEINDYRITEEEGT